MLTSFAAEDKGDEGGANNSHVIAGAVSGGAMAALLLVVGVFLKKRSLRRSKIVKVVEEGINEESMMKDSQHDERVILVKQHGDGLQTETAVIPYVPPPYILQSSG